MSVSIADLENRGNIPLAFSAASFSAISYGEVPSGMGQPLSLCIRQPEYSLWLSSNFAVLTGYCQQHHSYDLTLLIKLNLLFSLAAAAVASHSLVMVGISSNHWLLW
jgi:hypothetical protein